MRKYRVLFLARAPTVSENEASRGNAKKKANDLTANTTG